MQPPSFALNFCVLFWMPIKVPDQPTRLGEPLAAELAQLNDPEAKLKLKRSSRIAMPELISYTPLWVHRDGHFYIVSQWLAQYGNPLPGCLIPRRSNCSRYTPPDHCRGVLLIARTADIFVSADDAARLHHCLNASARRRLFSLSPTVMFGFSFIFGFCRRRRCSAWPRHDGCSVSSGQRPGHRHLLQCGEHLQFHHAASRPGSSANGLSMRSSNLTSSSPDAASCSPSLLPGEVVMRRLLI